MTEQTTTIYNDQTFYRAFIQDMLGAKKEVIIYSPFISKYRADFFRKTMIQLGLKNIMLTIFTRPIEEHEEYIQEEIRTAIGVYESIGANIIFLTGSIHEKIAVIDRKIIWTGSMNILSQRKSKEIMTRVDDIEFTTKVMSSLKLDQKTAAKGSPSVNLHVTILKSIYSSLVAIVRGIVLILLKSIMAVFKIVDVIL